MLRYLVGIDWASTKHDVCALDPQGQVLSRFEISHSAEGLSELLRRLGRIAAPEQITVCIERPSGLLVDTLLEAGFVVLPIHPNALKASRPRYSVELLARLRAAPLGHAQALESETKGQLVRSLVAVLRPLVEQIREIDGLLAAHLAQHPDGALLQSFPRSGSVNAAQILAELGDDRARFASFEQLAAEGGVAPVTHASGKHRGVTCRYACNKRLRQALTTWADNSRHASPWAAAMYRQARARGCDHPHAVRILARAWVRVLWRCWQERTPCDPRRHGRALPFLPPPHPASAAA